MKREEYKIPVTTKLKPEQAEELKNTCNFGGVAQSAFVREAIVEKLHASPISTVSGANLILYDGKTNSFTWKLRTDNGAEKTVVQDIPKEYLDDLTEKRKLAMHDRNSLVHKGKNEDSVAVPRRLVR